MFICIRGEEFDFARKVGMGLVSCAIELSEIILKEKDSIDRLIFVGSAGSYSKDIPIFSVLESKYALQIESSYLLNNSYTPIAGLENVSHETKKQIIVNSSNYITRDESVSSLMHNRGIALENMEFFSILNVAKYFNIPAHGIFCITNYCNANAHEEFLLNHSKAREILETYVKDNYEKYF